MSRPQGQGHRKSQSTSALSLLASPSSLSSSSTHEQSRFRASQHPALGRVEESSSSASVPTLPGISVTGHGTPKRSRSIGAVVGVDEVKGWLGDVMSLRSSDRRRLAALKSLEKTLVRCCARVGERGKQRSSAFDEGISLAEFIGLQVHVSLLSLFTRDTQTLSHPSQRSEKVSLVVGELGCLVGMLQGLCLLSGGCKAAVGESWVIENFIDLLLLLRAYPAPTEDGSKPISYSILELLFCVLVDSPINARTFERLNGLEAVVRVLKAGVAKEVRMKCIEFLYFYLLPEQSPSSRSVSSTSSSSGESNLFPPSPLSSSTSSNESDGRISPSPVPHKKACSTHADIDINFVPQTPRKPRQPSPGYLTPSTTARRVSASTTSTPSLPTVPASPRVAASPSSHHLASMAESPHDLPCPSPREKRSSSQWARPDHADGSTVGLGFGLPKSSSIAVGLCQSDETAIDIAEPPTPTFSDPFSSDSRSSSGSSTVLASPRSPMISRSSTQPSLTIVQSSPRDPSTRQTSVRRVSRSPLAQSLTPGEPSLPDVQAQVKPLPSPQIKHSRTQSHFSGLPPAPPVPVKHERRQSLAPPSKPSPVESHLSPFRPHRAFPAGLTRGLPSSASSPNLASPLRASKRIPSDKRPPSSLAPVSESPRLPTKMVKSGKDLRSVEEKKELLGSWLGNVDQLVQGVEKVSFWGSIGKERRG